MPIEHPVGGVVPTSEMHGESNEETLKLREMEFRARSFLSSFDWCQEIREFYFGDGIADIVAVFFARIESARPSVDEYLWVIVGEVPSAYLVVDASRTPREALEAYIGEMRKWVAVAQNGRHPDDVIPVNVPATPEWAEALASRLDFLEKKLIPHWPSKARSKRSAR